MRCRSPLGAWAALVVCLGLAPCVTSPAFLGASPASGRAPRHRLVSRGRSGIRPTARTARGELAARRAEAVQRAEAEVQSESDRNLKILLALQFPLFVGVGALIPILPLYGQQFGLAQSSVGILLSSPSVAKLALNFPMGRLADQVGRKTLMVGGMLVLAFGDAGTGLATTLPALILARLVTGAGLSVSDAGLSAWIADVTDARPDERSSFLGVQTAMISAAFVLGPALGGMAVDRFGMSSIFLMVAAGALVCAAGYTTLPETRQEAAAEAADQADAPPLQEMLQVKEQQALAGVSASFYAGAACKLAVVPAVASAAFGAAPTEVGQLFSGLAFAGILGTLAGGRLADAVGPRNVLAGCGAVCAIAYAGAALAVQAHTKDAFYGCLSVWALAAAVKSPALQSFAMAVAPAESRGAALSVPKVVGDLTFLIAPFLLGAMSDQLGPDVALAGCATIFAAGTAVFVAKTA